ncbi:MAG: class I SAM-dependent methyltransferase [Moraxellaceae bacterium]|nr:class I SAM-dependent methyltransferase [Moraxellaceae bacterium]
MTSPIKFSNGATYERFMGIWSQKVGHAFLDWLAPPEGAHWLDVGCGNGAFTELLVERCSPSAIEGIDPSGPQLAFAQERPALRSAVFQQGDAMALPYADNSVDAAVMPLVIFFVPDPALGVTEMVRVVRAGGSVSAYAWDMPGGGFPYALLQSALRECGVEVPVPPSAQVSSLASLTALWSAAGLQEVATHTITVERTFADFEDYWTTVQGGPSVSGALASLGAEAAGALQSTVRARLPVADDGSITLSARANAVKGRVPV